MVRFVSLYQLEVKYQRSRLKRVHKSVKIKGQRSRLNGTIRKHVPNWRSNIKVKVKRGSIRVYGSEVKGRGLLG